MKLGVLVLFALLVVTGVASAQVPESIVSRDIGYFQAGVDPATGGVPFQTNNYTVAQTICGQPRVATPSGTVINPSEVRFDDPANPSLQCVIPSGVAGAHLQSIPVGTGYRAAARSKGATLTSSWSALSNPFAIQPVAPVTPNGVVVR